MKGANRAASAENGGVPASGGRRANRATCTGNDDTLTLANRWISRSFSIRKGVATSHWAIRPSGDGAWLPMYSFVGSAPFDAEIVLDGTILRVGPWRHGHYGHEGHWAYSRHETWRTKATARLDVYLVPLDSAHRVTLILHNEMAHDGPWARRWVTVVNDGPAPALLTSMVVDVIPDLRVGNEVEVMDAYVAPSAVESPDFRHWRLHGFENDLDMPLAAGQSFESYPVYTLVSDGSAEGRVAAMNSLLRAEAPWATRPRIRHLFGRIERWEQILDVARRSRDLGFEGIEAFVNVVFTNSGDFDLHPKVFPRGEDDLREFVEAVHELGMTFVVYMGFCIANHGSRVLKEHPEWQIVGPEGRGFDPGSVGNMCLASLWRERLIERCRWLVDDIGVDGLATDGAYLGQPCHSTDHFHGTPGEGQYRSWRFEMDFYREMQQKGKIIETPSQPFALLNGATSIAQGYHEEDQQELELFDLVNTFRTSLYHGQMKGRPGWASWGFASIDPHHGHGLWPPEEHLTEYEHMIAGHFGYGLSAFIYGWELTSGPESERVLRRWIGFYKRYRKTLTGDAVFVRPPEDLRPDALMHVRPGAEVPAVMVVFNPSDKAVRLNWSVPLRRAGLAGEVIVRREGEDEGALCGELDDDANLAQRIDLAPHEVTWWDYLPTE